MDQSLIICTEFSRSPKTCQTLAGFWIRNPSLGGGDVLTKKMRQFFTFKVGALSKACYVYILSMPNNPGKNSGTAITFLLRPSYLLSFYPSRNPLIQCLGRPLRSNISNLESSSILTVEAFSEFLRVSWTRQWGVIFLLFDYCWIGA